MWASAAQPDLTARLDLPIAWYTILGVTFAVVSDVAEVLARVEETYAVFRQADGALESALVIQLRRDGDAYRVVDAGGYQRRWPDAQAALLDLLDRLVQGLLTRLHARGVYAIHASALAQHGRALAIAGKSGQGKTTLALGLIGRGLGLLSDEFAIVAPGTQQLLPYQRSLHIRPGTPELIPALRFLHNQARHRLGGGIAWAVAMADLERAFPGCLAPAAPLHYVLLLEGPPRPDTPPRIAPLSPALATIELLRGTWAASIDFDGGLARLAQLMGGVVCGRLRAGALESTLDCIVGWLEAHHG